MANHSLSQRYFTKLASNSIGVLLGLVIMSIIPRTFGPADLGRFEFITNNFDTILGFISLNIPLAYFNWISKKSEFHELSAAFISMAAFVSLIGLGFALFIGIALSMQINSSLWPDVPHTIIWAAFSLCFANFIVQVISYTADGTGDTVYLEIGRLIANVLRTACIIGLALLGTLSISSYFYIQTLIFGVLSTVLIVFLARHLKFKRFFGAFHQTRTSFQTFRRFAWNYSKPLVIYSALGFLCSIADRWLLQFSGGSIEQGYFAVAYRFGALAFIVTGSMTSVLSREFAIAHEKLDMDRLRALFVKVRVFYFISAVFGVFFFIEAHNLVSLFAGDRFESAALALAVMGLYPIHQTLGQLSGSFMMAIGHTKLYGKIGSLCLLLSLPLTWLFLADSPGLGLGSLGMSLKMVIVQLFTTNFILYHNTKYLEVSYIRWLVFQFTTVIGLMCLGFSSRAFTLFFVSKFPEGILMEHITPDRQQILKIVLELSVSFMCYLSFMVTLVAVFAKHLGPVKQHRDHLLNKIKSIFQMSKA